MGRGGMDEGLIALWILSGCPGRGNLQILGTVLLSNDMGCAGSTVGAEVAKVASRSVVLLLDAVVGGALDLERAIGQMLEGVCLAVPATGAIVTPVPPRSPIDSTRWQTIVVADIDRIAASLGVLALPAVLLADVLDETIEQIDALVRLQEKPLNMRVSGALSAADLH